MSLATVLNPTNNLVELYAVGTNGYPYSIAQTTPGNWSQATWVYLGPFNFLKDQPRIFSRLAAIVNQNNQTEVSGFGDGFNLWHTSQTTPGKWDGDSWENLQGMGISAPSVAMNANNTLQVFAVGTNLNVFCLQRVIFAG
jgi:hypothetical protein